MHPHPDLTQSGFTNSSARRQQNQSSNNQETKPASGLPYFNYPAKTVLPHLLRSSEQVCKASQPVQKTREDRDEGEATLRLAVLNAITEAERNLCIHYTYQI
jgi:hypothetical protein